MSPVSTVSAASSIATSATELHFAAGIPGFPAGKSFRVSRWGTGPTPFLVLDCADIAGLRFVVVNPALFFPWYEPVFGPEVYQAVGVQDRQEVDVLVILTLHSRPEDTTFNLLGPVVVNPLTGQAVQAVLSGSGYDPQTPIAAKS